MPFLKTNDGVSLFYNDWGAGRPVVLIHGWPLNSDFWEPQSTFLAANGYRVISYDRRGYGRSEQPWTGYDYDVLSDDLAALIEHLELRNVTLIGHSMGGGEVARYLSRHGKGKVAQAVLVSAVTPFLKKTEDNQDGMDQSVFDGLVQALEDDRHGFLMNFRESFFSGSSGNSPVSVGVLDWYIFLANQASLRAIIQCARAWSGTDFRPDMSAFTLPTLILHGGADANVPAETTGRIAARTIASARYIEYPNSGHAIGITDSRKVNADIRAFLDNFQTNLSS